MTTTYDSRGLPTVQNRPDQTDVPSTLGTDVRHGALWTVASNILLRFSNIIVMAIVARIVAPDELGVFALALAVQVLVVSVAEAGVATAIARTDLDAHRIAPTVVTISIATSFAAAALLALTAGELASAIGSPEATEPIRILALSVALTGPFAVPGAQLQREFRQDVVFRASLISFVPSSVTLIGLAIIGDGAIAFAWSRVIGHLVMGSIMVFALKERYRPGFNGELFGPLLRFGVPLAMASLLSQLVLNVDFVIVGRELSTADVGIYMLAFNIAAWPIAILGSVLNTVVIPAFSSMKRDGINPSHAVSKSVETVALLACPLGALTFTFATPLIVTVYGRSWVAASPILALLAVYGVTFAMNLLFVNIIAATGRTWMLMTVQVVVLIALVPAMLLGISTIGLAGVALAHIVVVVVIAFPSYLFGIRKATGAAITSVVYPMIRPALAAIGSASVALLVSQTAPTPWLQLLVGGLVGSLLYVTLTGAMLKRLLPPGLADHRMVSLLTTWPALAVARIRR